MYATVVSALFAIASLATTNAHPAPLSWYHERDSPVASLFVKRAPSPDDPNFASNYPNGWETPPASSLPKAWTDKLASIQMPNIQPAAPNNGYPTYAGGESGASDHICSFTYQCSTKDDLVIPPDGVLALAFDDGPTGSSPALYDFLQKNNIADKATHFMIGGNIVGNPKQMQAAANGGGHIAVHTWSHQYMTTLTNEQVLGELGWTMQIIADLNGGRVPKYWRPPYGDVDNRVRAIASGVFGLETVPWDKDSADWAISTGQYTKQSVEDTMNGWLTGPKSPGLNILEHELNANTINVFMDSYPKMVSNGWNVKNVADAWGKQWYQNSGSNTDAVASMAVAGGAVSAASSTMSASTNSSLSSRSESATSMMNSQSGSQSQSQSLSQSQSITAASATTTQQASGAASAGSAAKSPSQSGGAGAMAQPGMLLAMIGAVGALFL